MASTFFCTGAVQACPREQNMEVKLMSCWEYPRIVLLMSIKYTFKMQYLHTCKTSVMLPDMSAVGAHQPSIVLKNKVISKKKNV